MQSARRRHDTMQLLEMRMRAAKGATTSHQVQPRQWALQSEQSIAVPGMRVGCIKCS